MESRAFVLWQAPYACKNRPTRQLQLAGRFRRVVHHETKAWPAKRHPVKVRSLTVAGFVTKIAPQDAPQTRYGKNWLRGLDSNQDNQLQRLACYQLHYPGK